MKLFNTFGAAIALTKIFAYQDVRQNMGDYKVVHLESEHLTPEVQRLLGEIGADHIGMHESGVAMKLHADGLRRLEDAGVAMDDATDEWVNHFQSNFDNPKLFCTESDMECADKSGQEFYATYQPLGAMHLRVEQATANLDYARTFTLALSYYEQKIQMTEIGDMEKPLAFFICNIHAREWLTPMFCTHMVEQLVAEGGHPLLEHFSFAIITSANPDGYEYSRLKANMWRKTRKPIDSSTCVGTDGNRNYDNHHCEEGSSTNPCFETYCGVEPFDQPETAAIRDYAIAHADNLIVWTDFHSFAKLWISPYGYTTEVPEQYPNMLQCAEEAKQAIFETNGIQFVAGNSGSKLYINSGSSTDWFYDSVGVVYAYLAEFRGNSFQPDPSNIIPSNAEIFAGMEAQMKCVGRIELGIDYPEASPIAYPTASPTIKIDPPDAPANFTCNPAFYDADDGCDCNCGSDVDPDCDKFGTRYGCVESESCLNGVCTVMEYPSGWLCPGEWYGTGNGCDCGCGIKDPDCDANPTSEPKDRCAQYGTCLDRGGTCVSDDWTCARELFDANDGCHCGCGAQDPDCDTPGQAMIGCEDDEICVRAECIAAIPVPEDWTCTVTWYGTNDGCDCNCGAHDPDCDTTGLVAWNCEEGYKCIEAECTFLGGPDWTCDKTSYDGNDGCDCNCGVPDPDCDKEYQSLFGCEPGETCTAGSCFRQGVAGADSAESSGSQTPLFSVGVLFVTCLGAKMLS